MENDNKKSDISVKNEIRTTSGKEIKKHLWAFLLVAFGILLFLALNNVASIFTFIVSLIVVLSPLFIGALIALILNTPMTAIGQFITWAFGKIFSKKDKDAKPNKRGIEIASLILTILLALLLIYIIVYSVVPQLIKSVTALKDQIENSQPFLLSILDKLDEFGIRTDSAKKWVSELNFRELIGSIDLGDMIGRISGSFSSGGFAPTSLVSNAKNIIDTVISGASTIISGTFTAFMSVVFAIYILANKHSLSTQMKKLGYAYMSEKKMNNMISFCSTVGETFSNFISGQCLDAVILGLMMFVSMSLFGFGYALPISAMITITAIIPYVGAFLGGAFGVLLIIMDSPVKAILFVILFIIIQQIDNHVVYPRVVGSSVGLPPIWTFVAVIIGGAFFKIIGMVLFIPLFSVFYTIIERNVTRRLDERGIEISSDTAEDSDKPKKQSRLSALTAKIAAWIKKVVAEIKEKTKRK